MTKIQNLSEVDSNTREGRYLIAAIAKITTESQTDKTPDEVLEQCYLLQEKMFKDDLDVPTQTPNDNRPPFVDALQTLINQYSAENGSNTPDFILANFVFKALINFDDAVNHREKWYGR